MKMKIFSLLIIAPVLLSAQSDSLFIINGKLKNIKDSIQWVFLDYRLGRHFKSDSVLVENNSYEFRGTISQPLKGTLSAQYQSRNEKLNMPVAARDFISFIIERGNINITSIDSFANATIDAGEGNKEFIKLNKKLRPYMDKMDHLWAQYDEAEKNRESVSMKKYREEVKITDSLMKENVYHNYLIENSKSPIALYVLQTYAGYAIDPGKIEPLYNQLAPSLCGCEADKYFYERIQIAKQTATGKMAMDFEQTDTAGNIIKLSFFRGKYVLLNFWASWCSHCARDNPHLVAIFNKYKDRPFTILSVSVDRPGKKENWLNAIRTTHLAWTHVSDLQEWDNSVAIQYGITSIPQNFLIDPKGKIIARNLMGENLDKKLEGIFAKGN